MGSRKAEKPLHYDLEVWKDAMRLARGVYRASADFPEQERFGLVAQVRRAVVSVASNIAEGAGRGSRPLIQRVAAMLSALINSKSRISEETSQ
ncbi:MAG: four helix bundle protein [Pseudomonadota bacterium]|nr:four helix bundle protein [Pseudomonadota bacterium]